MSELRLRKVAVILPTITGREDEFNRCMESLKLAEDLAPRGLEVRYFISKDSSREEILKNNIKEISENFDVVTFVDDDDYVRRSFFSLPKTYDDNTIYQIKSLTMRVYRYYRSLISGGFYYPVLEGCECAQAFFKIYYQKDGSYQYYLRDCHLWGYFYPSKIIKELTEELLIPRPEVTGPWEDTCYWTWIITKYGDNLRWLNSSIYFHTALNRNSLAHKLSAENKLEKLDIIKSINKDVGTVYLSRSGHEGNFNEIWGFGADSRPLKEFIDMFELKEHRLTKKERAKFRKVIQHESWKDVDKEEFSSLLKLK